MAEFQNVMRQYKRMCEGFPVCGEACPLYASLGICVGQDFLKNNSEEFEQVVMKWAAEHPEKTMKDVFFEKFPNAPRDEDGEPTICPMAVGFPAHVDGAGYAGECLSDKCRGCWSRPAPEE